jgi:hypothetical protein
MARQPRFKVGDRVLYPVHGWKGTISRTGKYYALIDCHRPAVRFDCIPVGAGDLEVDEVDLQPLSALEQLAEQAE